MRSGKSIERCAWPECVQDAKFGALRETGTGKQWGHWCGEHQKIVANENLMRWKAGHPFNKLKIPKEVTIEKVLVVRRGRGRPRKFPIRLM